MATATLRNEERIGLVVALAAHVGLIAWLALWRPSAEPLELPGKVSVTLSEEVAPVATTPEPSANPAPDSAPELGEVPPPPAPLARPEPQPAPPQPVARAVPAPKPVTRPVQPPLRPVARPVQPPRRDAIADLLAKRTPAARPPGRPAATNPPRTTPSGRPGGARFADAFEKGIPGATGAGQPSAQPGPAQVSSIRGSINARVRVPWNSCAVTGLDVNKLRASVTFSLDKQGGVTSVSAPQVTGISDANRAQAARFGECAVKAIRTAAPYANLPVEFYDHWKTYKLNFRKE